ncbi:MAG: hypothetical protein LBI61_01635 [Puniceicoccales bacterium]|nr:hypothetical protein [Puniceicoccales bacterium]
MLSDTEQEIDSALSVQSSGEFAVAATPHLVYGGGEEVVVLKQHPKAYQFRDQSPPTPERYSNTPGTIIFANTLHFGSPAPQRDVVLTSLESSLEHLNVRPVARPHVSTPPQSSHMSTPAQSPFEASAQRATPGNDRSDEGVLSRIQSIVDITKQSIQSIVETAQLEEKRSTSSTAQPIPIAKRKPAAKKKTNARVKKDSQNAGAKKFAKPAKQEGREKEKPIADSDRADIKLSIHIPPNGTPSIARTNAEAEANRPQGTGNNQQGRGNGQQENQEGNCSTVLKGIGTAIGALVITGTAVIVSVLTSKNKD